MTSSPKLSISIVSHGQSQLIRQLLKDCGTFRGATFEILLTLNIPEDKKFLVEFQELPLILIENARPKGFGENHNAAFEASNGDVFIVVNPDIRAPGLDLSTFSALENRELIGAHAPKVLNIAGEIEDSARRFPTFSRLFSRVVLRRRQPDYDLAGQGKVAVDWVAGMFVAFPRAAFRTVGGFDTRYFMYMEDADICRRLRLRGYDVVLDGATSVVPDARRASRRSLRHLSWHARSALRFLIGI